MNPSEILARAKALVGVVEDDTLARVALAIQNSEFGAGRRVDAIIAELENRAIPRFSTININALRAIVMRVTGKSIELDDPLLLLLVATQDLGLKRLEQAIESHKIIEDQRRHDLWFYRTLCYCLGAGFVCLVFTIIYFLR